MRVYVAYFHTPNFRDKISGENMTKGGIVDKVNIFRETNLN